MRIDERNMPPVQNANARPQMRAGAPAFSPLAEPNAVPTAARTVQTQAVSDLSALFQLQIETQSPKDSRKRSVRRGSRLLDALDRLKIASLAGEDRPDDWQALAALFDAPRDPNLPPEVADLLDQVDLRVAVELAKRGL